MASGSEDIAAASASQPEDEHKEKKKKSGRLGRMWKLITGSRKSTKSKESVKAKSTGALHQNPGLTEDDDEGGFVPSKLQGSRSISEDSVFKPEQKEGGLEAFRQTTVSMEQVNKSDFRSELFRKLKRRTMSQSDEDDGLPQSPAPHVTTADLILGGGLQSSSTGKSTSRESDKSLLSVDGSENEEEDLFDSNWKSSIASVKKPQDNSTAEVAKMDLDFTVVKRDTQTLTSDAAKHRISIKPKSRKSSLQSRRATDRTTASPLPRVTEETTKQAELITVQDNKTSIQVIKPQKVEESVPKEIKSEMSNIVKNRKSSEGPSEPQKTQPEKDILVSNEEKSRLSDTPILRRDSEKIIEKKDEPVKVESLKSVKPRPKSLVDVEPIRDTKDESNELSKAFKRMSLRKEIVSPEMPAKASNIEPLKEVISVTSVTESKAHRSSVKTDETKEVESKPTKSPITKDAPGKTTYVLKKEPLRPVTSPKSPDYENLQDLNLSKSITSPSSDYENVPVGGFKSEKSELSSPEPDYDNLSPISYPLSPTANKFLPRDIDNASKSKTSTMPQKLSSPKEEYRLKRQPRSRTLPEQPVSREILDSKSQTVPREIMDSQSLDVGEKSVKKLASKTDSFKENNGSSLNRFSKGVTSGLSVKTAENKIDIESTAPKDEPKRPVSLKSDYNVSTTPSWVKPKPEERTPNVVKSDSQDKAKFEQLKPVSVNSAKEKETKQLEPSNTKPQDLKKEDLPQKPPLKTKPKEVGSSTLERKSLFENTSSSSPASVPAWKANLSQKKGSLKEKDIKIEIIEKKTPVPEKVEEPKQTPVQLRGKPACAEESKAARKSSNVLDMVKNFQSMQAT
ncbi:E3 ubiquitin-protein ligase RBBP6-like isoform X2 [Saccostrea echinata]|uniref:E3 ubiquitin-protein ligase RBBP6-like isoform X2 n=1 Tax=Saccostrea echinata TaxID=191078 RepID=UPI002A81BA84|nr:E3 ubiquitin-protein ligase RBBP6-like isoform X2 [Saccostrea echinata]